MKINNPEKEGKDCGVGRLRNSFFPRDEAVASDPRNFENKWDVRREFDGTEATAWDAVLGHGLSIDNVQKSPNAKASLKDR